jgi:ATP-binding cassette, subfamily B, multidrug efflux pump
MRERPTSGPSPATAPTIAPKGHVRQTLRDLFAYIDRYRVPYVVGLVMVVVASFVTTLTPIVVGGAIDAFTLGTMTMTTVWWYMGAILGLMLVTATSMIVARRTTLNASWEIQFDIRRDLFRHFTRLDADYYDNHRVGDLMARLTADLNAVRMLVGVGIFQGVFTALMIAFTLYRMVMLDVGLTLLTLTVVPIITVSFFVLLRIIHRRYERVQEQFSNVSAMAQENFSGIRVVKGFGIEHRELDTFKSLNDEFIRRNLQLKKVDGPLFPLMELLFGIAISLLLLVGGRSVLGVGSALTIGEFSAFVFLFEGIQWPLIALGWIANMLQRGSTSWHRLRSILDAQPRINDDDDTDHGLRSIRGDIEFRDVTLSLDGQLVLDRLSFHVRAGESIGITGRTGSGKTLIVNLIGRILDPDEGEILIDGVPIRRYPVRVLRRYIGLVPQEPFLFSDSIAENIAYGIPETDDEEGRRRRVLEVARVAQLAGDVEGFPLGLDTPLGERGVTLSGGQRQRTAIARAIIRDPSILIFDDALSAVDTQTEAAILRALREVQRGRTTLVIAHRLSAFEHCDRVYVIDEGRITESGRHDELVAHDGWYADMARRQQLEEDLEAA